jgi:hypothetical protein
MNIHRLFSRGCCLFKSQGDVTPTPNRVMQDTIREEFEGAGVGYTMYGNPYLWMVYRVDDILSCAAYFGGGFTTSFYSRYHRERVDTLLFENCTTLQTLEFTTVPDTGESDYTEEFLELEL